MVFICCNSFVFAKEELTLNNHYDFSLSKDMPLTFLAAFSSAYGYYRYSQMSAPSDGYVFSESKLLPWDKPIAGRYSEFADKMSDWGSLLGVIPIAMGGASFFKNDVSGKDYGVYMLMFTQALAIQSSLNLMVRSLEFWPRPYIYATQGEGRLLAQNANPEAYGSFYSGHASAAFTVAVFTGEWFSEVYPNSPYKKIVWASALSLAGFEGALRIAAGKHYLSDVIIGALAGTGVSLAIINIHKNHNEKVAFWAGLSSCGVTIRL